MKNKILFTGSRVYGPINKDSDLDIVLFSNTARLLKGILHFLAIVIYQRDINDYNEESFYFDLLNMKVNIIVVKTSEEFNNWCYATEMMSKLFVIEDKAERVIKFEEFFKEEKSDG